MLVAKKNIKVAGASNATTITSLSSSELLVQEDLLIDSDLTIYCIDQATPNSKFSSCR